MHALQDEGDDRSEVDADHIREEEQPCALGGLPRRSRPVTQVILAPLFGFGRGPNINSSRISCIGQMPGHRITHNTQPDKGDFFFTHLYTCIDKCWKILTLANPQFLIILASQADCNFA